MSTEVATIQTPAELLEKVVVGGDLSKLTSRERMLFYNKLCESAGLNPLSRPFEYLTLNGKLTLYARKDATDQLREIHGVSITSLEREMVEGIYCVTVHAINGKGRTDTSIGAVALEGLRGEARANGIMKAETKGKRRVTLSICGLGLLDETEVETIPGTMLGEPPDLNETDRARLLEQIAKDARDLGLMKSEYKAAWNRYVGHDVKEADAPIAMLVSLAGVLAERLALKRTQQPTTPQEEAPF
jgi:hypothetical protein